METIEAVSWKSTASTTESSKMLPTNTLEQDIHKDIFKDPHSLHFIEAMGGALALAIIGLILLWIWKSKPSRKNQNNQEKSSDSSNSEEKNDNVKKHLLSKVLTKTLWVFGKKTSKHNDDNSRGEDQLEQIMPVEKNQQYQDTHNVDSMISAVSPNDRIVQPQLVDQSAHHDATTNSRPYIILSDHYDM